LPLKPVRKATRVTSGPVDAPVAPISHEPGGCDVPDRVLVTGGAGFIGSHLCEALARDGVEVWVLDNFDDHYSSETKRRNIASVAARPGVHVVQGDVRDMVLTGGLFSDVGYDAVVHLAALPGVEASMDNPDTSYEMNVRGTLRLLESMERHGVRHLVLASSAAVYGRDTPVPFAEDGPAEPPVSPYGAGKRAVELLAHSYHGLHDLSVLCARPFTVYGPRQRPEMAIHRFARLLQDGEPIPIHGDGSSLRDYVHVDDVVAGIRLSVEHLLERDEAVYEAVNIGSGEPVALWEMVSLLGDAMGVDPVADHVPRKPWRSDVTHASLEKARELLGYRPTVELPEGLADFVAWFRSDGVGSNGDGPGSDANASGDRAPTKAAKRRSLS